MTYDRVRVVSYGPDETRVGTSFNEQPDGSCALWFEVDGRDDCPLAVEFDGVFLKSVRKGSMLTALLPLSLIAVPRELNIRIFDETRPDNPVLLQFYVLNSRGKKIRGKVTNSATKVPIPGFFIIGPPRSGTTSIYWRLQAHPRVYMSRNKEPYFFDPRAEGVLNGAVINKDEYLSLFRFAPYQSQVIGEASTTYASSPEALRGIQNFNPQAKALLILRNPITASLSLYLQHRRGGLHEQASSFKQAWRECENAQLRPFISNYRNLYKIGDQLVSAAKIFGERFHVMVFDDLVNDGTSAYADLLQFLGLPVDSMEQLEKTNSSQLEKIESIVSPELLDEMIDFFLPQIRLVSEFIGRDLGHWIAR